MPWLTKSTPPRSVGHVPPSVPVPPTFNETVPGPTKTGTPPVVSVSMASEVWRPTVTVPLSVRFEIAAFAFEVTFSDAPALMVRCGVTLPLIGH